MTESPPGASRLDGDSRRVVLIVLWLMASLTVAAFVMGVPGLVMVAEWAGLESWTRYLVPVALDAGIVIMALAAVVRRARFESTRFTVGALAVLTALSVVAQVAHVVIPAWGQVAPQDVVGAGVASLAPLMVFAATHALLDLAIAPPVKRKRGRTRPTTGRTVRSTEPVQPTAAPAQVSQPPAQVNQSGDPGGQVAEPMHPDQAEPGEPGDQLTALVQTRRDEGATDAEIAAELKGQGLTNGEIAEVLGVSVSTVKRLRAQVEQNDQGEKEEAA